MKDHRNKCYYADGRYYKTRKKKGNNRFQKIDIEISGAPDIRAATSHRRKLISVKTVRLKKQHTGEKKATRFGFMQAISGYDMSLGYPNVRELRRFLPRRKSVIDRGWNHGSYFPELEHLGSDENLLGMRESRDRRGDRLTVNPGHYGSYRENGEWRSGNYDGDEDHIEKLGYGEVKWRANEYGVEGFT
uniref:Uncharacterized protein n=1 Tax=Noccaea caerulescens TaxID=107243 RepID=A0A1J3D8V0_NOCCA